MAQPPNKKKSSGTSLVVVPSTGAHTSTAYQNERDESFISHAFTFTNPLMDMMRCVTTIKPDIKLMEKAMTQSKAQYEKLTNEAANTSKEGFEALMKSTNIWMKGTEDLFKTYMSLAQDTAAKNTEALKTLLACKNLNELTEAQNKLAQESFDGFMAGATKISELSVKLATEALEPINDQVSKTIRKATDAVAA